MNRKMIALAGAVLAGVSVLASPSDPQPTAASSNEIIVDVTKIPVPIDLTYRGNARAIVTFADQGTVDRRCGAAGPGHRTVACVSEIGVADMTLPNPCDVEFQGEDYAAVVCHEKGHVLGWRHEMPHVYGSPELKAPRN